jgi:flavin-binding protein dodecin
MITKGGEWGSATGSVPSLVPVGATVDRSAHEPGASRPFRRRKIWRNDGFGHALPPRVRKWNIEMSVARITEISASSTMSFEDALRVGLERANRTLRNVRGAWVQGQQIVVEDGEIAEFRVNMKVTFVLED